MGLEALVPPSAPSPRALRSVNGSRENERSRRTRSYGLALLAILALGACFRAVRLTEERRGPLGQVLLGDEASYERWAERILDPAAPYEVPFQAPLQAYHIAAWRAVFPADPAAARDAVRWVGVLLGLGTILLAAALGRRLGGPMAGLLAALWVALYRPLIYHEPTLLRDGPATFATTLSVWLLVRWGACPPPRRSLLLGLCLGLGALVRENLLLLGLGVLAGGAWIAVRQRPRRGRAAVGVAALLLGLFLPLAPWIVRNHRAEGGLFLIPTWNGGTVFYGFNRRDNLTRGYVPPTFVGRANAENERAAYLAEASRRAGRRLTPHEASSFWLRAALADIAATPRLYVVKVLCRCWGLLASTEDAQARDMELDRAEGWVLGLPLLDHGLLSALALLGLPCALRRGGGARRLALSAVFLAGTIVSVGLVTRYRLPLVPLFAGLASLALRGIGRSLAHRARLRRPTDLRGWAMDLSRRRESTAWLLGAAGALALGLLLAQPRPVSHDAGHVNRAIAWHALRRFRLVESELQAVQEPDALAHELLAEALLRRGAWAEAARAYRRALARDEERARCWAGLATALERLGRREEALKAVRRARALEDHPEWAALERALAR